MQILGQLVSQLAHTLPLPVTLGLAIALAMWMAPRWWRARKERYLRALVRQMLQASPASRAALQAKTLKLAGSTPYLLAALAHEAHQRQMPQLEQRAFQGLDNTQAGRQLADKLRKASRRLAAYQETAFDAMLSIRAQWEAGQRGTAQERLTMALKQWPHDPDLRELDAWFASHAVDDTAP